MEGETLHYHTVRRNINKLHKKSSSLAEPPQNPVSVCVMLSQEGCPHKMIWESGENTGELERFSFQPLSFTLFFVPIPCESCQKQQCLGGQQVSCRVRSKITLVFHGDTSHPLTQPRNTTNQTITPMSTAKQNHPTHERSQPDRPSQEQHQSHGLRSTAYHD